MLGHKEKELEWYKNNFEITHKTNCTPTAETTYGNVFEMWCSCSPTVRQYWKEGDKKFTCASRNERFRDLGY